MTQRESMVLSEVDSVPGLTIQLRFDSEYFKTGRIFMVDEWEVKMPREKDGKYEQIRVRRSCLAMVTGLECGGTVLGMMEIHQETGGIRNFDIQESHYRHGYWGLTPVKIEKEGENSNG